jgi:hypothetical protein
MRPTTSWYCDTCGQLIKNASDGIIEWLIAPGENGVRGARGLRIVHRREASPRGPLRCDSHHYAATHKETVTLREVPLAGASMCDANGPTALLCAIERDGLPRAELLELFKRLDTPGYEHARPWFHCAAANGVIQPSQPDGYHTQAEIAAVLAFAKTAG